MFRKITVIGAGNGGHAMSFLLARDGYQVMLFEHPSFAGNLKGIEERGGIEAVDRLVRDGKEIPAWTTGFAKIHGITTDMKTAIGHADFVLMIVPSFAQEPMFELAIPHLRDGQVFAILPGNFASLVFKRMLREKGIRKKVIFAETNTIPPACRIVEPGKVFIVAYKEGLEVATLPSPNVHEVAQELKNILRLETYPLKNVLEAGFENVNMVVHPATAVLNMGVAESRQGAFHFYKEGMSISVSKVQQTIDDERLAVGKALNLQLRSFIEVTKMIYHFEFDSIREFALNSPVHNSFGYDAPSTPRDRYINEDCPYLLVPVHAFGKLLGIEASAMESIIRIASIYNEVDYFKEGRSLEKMGVSGMDREEILEYVQRGV